MVRLGESPTIKQSFSRVGFLMLAAAIFMILAVAISIGANAVTNSSRPPPGIDPIDPITAAVLLSQASGNLVSLQVARLFLYYAQGLLACAFICNAAAGVISRRVKKQLAQMMDDLERGSIAYTLGDLHSGLETSLMGIQASAMGVLEEARTKESDVQELERRVQQLTALASIKEEQAQAVQDVLRRDATRNLVLAITGIIATLVLGVWALVIALR
jgi:hypothetical protein